MKSAKSKQNWCWEACSECEVKRAGVGVKVAKPTLKSTSPLW